MLQSRHALAALLGTTQLLAWAMTYYIPAIMAGPVAASLGMDLTTTLGGFSLALLVTGLGSPFACRRIEQAGGRGVLMAGTLLMAAGLAVMAACRGPVGWYAGWAIAGAGMAGGLYDACFATAGRLVGDRAREVITGITLLGGFASTLGWPLGAWLVPEIGWRATLLVYAATLLLVNLPLLALLPRAAPPMAPAAVGPRPVNDGHRALFLCIAGFFTVRAVAATMVAVSAPVLLQGAGIEPAAAIGLVALIGPAQVGMRLIQAAAGRRWSPLGLAWISAALLPMVTVPLALGAGPVWLWMAGLVFALGFGASNGILTIARGTLPLFLFGPVGYATRIGQLARPVILAQAAAPLLWAPIIAAQPAETVFGLLGWVTLAAAAFLLPIGWLRRARGAMPR